MNRKAYVGDFALFAIIVFVMAIILLFVGFIITNFNTEIQKQQNLGVGKRIFGSFSDMHSSIFDWVFVIIFFFLALGIFVTSFMIDTHPALFFVLVFVMGFILVAMAVVGNIFESLSAQSSLALELNAMPMTKFIMHNWLIIITVIGFTSMILLFSKVGRA